MLQDNSLLDNHIDYKGRFTNNPGFNQTGDHGEHCGGIIAAAGNLDPRGKGMAIGADVLVYSPNNNNYNDVPSYTEWSLNGRYNVSEMIEVRLGISNLFDITPPRNPGTYDEGEFFDAYGRRFNLGLNLRF